MWGRNLEARHNGRSDAACRFHFRVLSHVYKRKLIPTVRMCCYLPSMLADIYLITLALLSSFTCWYRWCRRRLPLPPGPKGYPIVGNLFDMPHDLQWEKYFDWSKKYNSDIIYLSVFGAPIVVLNSYEAANDLLSGRSLLYSDRPISPMLNELLGWGSLMTFMPYGRAWRARRRAFWREFNSDNSKNHHPKQLWHARDLLRRLLDDPKRFLHHID